MEIAVKIAVYLTIGVALSACNVWYIRTVYQRRAQTMEAALEAQLDGAASWSSPSGGLFLWVRLDAELSIDRLFERALEAEVAFVPGDPFFVEPSGRPFMRLNFSHRPEAAITEGMRRLAIAIEAERDAQAKPRLRYDLMPTSQP